MAIASKDILALLKEWPSRIAGSETELEAREALMAKLLGEYGVDVKEEGIYAPPYARYHILLLIVFSLVTVALFFLSPIIGVISLLLVSYAIFLFITGRRSPLSLMVGAKVTANLIGSKGFGDKHILILAPLDNYSGQYSDKLPAFFNEQDQGKNIDVAASIAAASRLWKNIPDGYELSLCLFSGTVADNIGTHQYIQQHNSVLKTQAVHIFSLSEKMLIPFRNKGLACQSIDANGDASATNRSNALEAAILEMFEA
jgi:hypothetical protein